MNRPTVMDHRGGWRSRLLRVWQRWEAVGLDVTFHHPDDLAESTWNLELPSWPWRCVCWVQGHRPYGPGKDNYCIVCRKALGHD